MAEPLTAAPLRQVWHVGALLLATGDALQSRFGAVSVMGEISGVSRAASGHRYFALKDVQGSGALLRCAMFRRAALLAEFEACDGQQVEVRGRITVYEPRGELQLVVESMRRFGAGALYERFLQLKARLEAAGLFDVSRKRGIAPFPAALGIVTSLQAAALHDVLATLARRAPHVRVIVYPSAVQGADAPAALVAALGRAAVRREVDSLLLVRGGGSLEDLWAFNDEALVHAILASPIPVVCGVGHESDVTLADLAADLRAATPTAAAELAAPPRAPALQRLDTLAAALQRRMQRSGETQAQRLDALALRFGGPRRALVVQRQSLASLERRLCVALHQCAGTAARQPVGLATRLLHGTRRQLERRSHHLQAAGQRLAALAPQRVLARGYAWVADPAGKPVMSAGAVQPGDRLRAVWFDGFAQVEVQQVQASTPDDAKP